MLKNTISIILTFILGIFLGWPEIILALFLAFASGAVYGIISIALSKKKLRSQVPFAPFLVFGSMISLFFYDPVTEWYLRLLR